MLPKYVASVSLVYNKLNGKLARINSSFRFYCLVTLYTACHLHRMHVFLRQFEFNRIESFCVIFISKFVTFACIIASSVSCLYLIVKLHISIGLWSKHKEFYRF